MGIGVNVGVSVGAAVSVGRSVKVKVGGGVKVWEVGTAEGVLAGGREGDAGTPPLAGAHDWSARAMKRRN